MKYMTSTEIRNMWYSFFKSKGHKEIESASLVPIDDNSLFFVNAGVTPLKKYFDGSVVPDSKRLTSIQKCIRTNDIENVGVTKRHQTFFEMMGNFSIGDYFKEEALEFAFELLTSKKYFAIDKDLIYATIYTNDEDAYNKWVSLGLDPSHIVRLEENFWEIGSGPCGPDSEIFFDRGSKYDPDGKALEHFKNDEEQERFVEIWNNVFSQFNSEPDKDRSEYKELPHKNIDTGAGLERWCCILQGVDSNFDTDLFVPIIKKIEEISGKKYKEDVPFKVIADHIRAITMALSDGASFENSGRGYVLRRLLRRSVRMGKKIGINEPFMYKLVPTVIDIMKDSYPRLLDTKDKVIELIINEEKQFNEILSIGEKKLDAIIKNSKNGKVDAKEVFKLYDTYGFPVEITIELLDEEHIKVDKEELDSLIEEARRLAKEAHKDDANMNIQNEALLNFTKKSEFTYEDFKLDSKVIGLFKDGVEVEKLDGNGLVVFEKTPFYAESGGQVGDTGSIYNKSFKANVVDTKKAPNGQTLHVVEITKGSIKIGDTCTLEIDKEKRLKTRCNHSSVHLVQKALQDIVDSSIHQAGSYVDNERMRFDFIYQGKITNEQILEVENRVNEIVKESIPTDINYMSLEEAKKTGAMALFTLKYKEEVRVVTIGPSKELCGGTHVLNTDEIKKFAILKVESKGSNVYRLEGTTNDNIEVIYKEFAGNLLTDIDKEENKLKELIDSAKKDNIVINKEIPKINKKLTSYKDYLELKNSLDNIKLLEKDLEKEYNDKKSNMYSSNLDEYLDNLEEINGIKTLIINTNNEDINILKDLCDKLMVKIEQGFVIFVNDNNDKENYICKSNSKVYAGNLIKELTSKYEGKGGGSPTFAQGGSSKVDFEEVKTFIIDYIKNM